MRKFTRFLFHAVALSTLIFQLSPPSQAAAQAGGCQEGVQSGGARYRACLPDGSWNGDLVVYAHGYVPSGSALGLPGEAGAFSTLVRQMGYAFATTSYHENGLAVLPAIDDLLDLVQIFREQHGAPRRVFLIGASEGGLITALSIERHPEVYAGGLALCSPIGDFPSQVDYFGDFRLVFDAYFPGLIPGDPLHIPPDVIANWPAIYQQKILPVLQDPARRSKLADLLAVTGAPFDPQKPATLENSIRGVLGYNIYATNDARGKLGGQPYDNTGRAYSGSEDDAWLNQNVRRVQADPQAASALEEYRTTGQLPVPLVAMHTTGDEIVPFRHLDRYRQKVAEAGYSPMLETIPVERYGHCDFQDKEILTAFDWLIQLVDSHPTPAPTASLAPTMPTPTLQSTPTQSSTVVEKPVENQLPEKQGVFQRFWLWITGHLHL